MQKAVELAPSHGEFWNTLGVAQYRAGNWQLAIDSLNKSMELRGGGDAFDWFVLAMAYQRFDEPDKAQKWYEKGIAWMDKQHSDDQDLRLFRSEASQLIDRPAAVPKT